MKRMWAALLLCGALSSTIISARAHDLDFPNQLRAINVCHTQWSSAKSKASGRVTVTKQPRIILTAMQNHQRRAQAEPTQRLELRAFQVIYLVCEEH